MPRKKKQISSEKIEYSKDASFENLKVVQEMALNRKGKNDEISPDISIFLKAEELKGKLCGLYSDADKKGGSFNIMSTVKIDGEELKINVGEDIKTEMNDD